MIYVFVIGSMYFWCNGALRRGELTKLKVKDVKIRKDMVCSWYSRYHNLSGEIICSNDPFSTVVKKHTVKTAKGEFWLIFLELPKSKMYVTGNRYKQVRCFSKADCPVLKPKWAGKMYWPQFSTNLGYLSGCMTQEPTSRWLSVSVGRGVPRWRKVTYNIRLKIKRNIMDF